MLTNGIKYSNREQAQEEEIAKLKETVDAQQTRLHRMQKELQFLVTRQQVCIDIAMNNNTNNNTMQSGRLFLNFVIH